MDSTEESAKLRALVREQDRAMQLLRSELNASKMKLKDFETQVQSARHKQMMKDAIPPADPRIPVLEAAGQDARKRVADLEQSLSWRITAPLRMVGRTLGGR